MVFLNFALPVSAATYQGTNIPEILPRSTWENTESLKNLLTWRPGEDTSSTASKQGDIDPPDYFAIERIIIHDMGCDTKKPGCNNKERDPLETIQGIYRYHSVTQGWGDIGYHYIIDYWGRIYEGRYGGNGARGAHTYYNKNCDNFNVGTVGILLMGNYEKATLSEIMYKSLSELVAWVSATNSLDPTDSSYYSEVWHSPKQGKTCDISRGGLTSAYTGPIVIGHNDVEESNSDPGTVDLKRVRKEAKEILLDYEKYLFTIKDDSKTYTIKEGQVQEFKSDTKNYKIVNLAKNQFSAFPRIYPDGVLVKGKGPEVYLIQNKEKRHILSPLIFETRGFKWKDIINVTEQELVSYPIGQNILLADGVLIKGLSPEVYLVKSQKRYWIKTAEVFSELGYKWQNIIELSQQEINQYALGMVIDSISTLAGEPRPASTEQEPVVRVGIYSAQNGEIFKIIANGPYEIYKNNQFLALKNKDEIFEVKIYYQDNFKFIPKTESIVFEILSYEDRPQWNPELNDNLFRGNIEVKYSNKSKKVWIINELGLENYLKGVAEAIDAHPVEYLKTLIIAARSYTLFHIQNKGKYPDEIFHIRNWAYDQLYKGYGFESRAPNITKAVEETKGTIIGYNGKPVRGVYSSDSGGTTKDACQVWGDLFCGKDYDYLRGGVVDPAGTIHNSDAVKASHGVGISAVGARKLAESGKTYQEILKYYYQGVEIEKIY